MHNKAVQRPGLQILHKHNTSLLLIKADHFFRFLCQARIKDVVASRLALTVMSQLIKVAA